MGTSTLYHFKFNNRISLNAGNSKGISLLFIIFLMLILSMSVISFLTFGVKLRDVEKDRITSERLETVREALQRYYLSHQNLPAPVIIDDLKTIPTKPLNLPQQYRFDSSGEFIHYNWKPLANGSDTVDIKGLNYGDNEKRFAAVIVASGPNKKIESEIDDYTYDNSGTDDIVEAISLNAEAIKIATKAVNILQAAAKAYDNQFKNISNDGYTIFEWILNWNDGPPPGWEPDPDDPDAPPPITHRYFRFETKIETNLPDRPNPEDDDDEIERRKDEIERRKVPAEGGFIEDFPVDGENIPVCLPYSKRITADPVNYSLLTNDPLQGIYTLDACGDLAAMSIVAVFGLNKRYITDPWGTPYQWGNSSDYDPEDRHYWSFFSKGGDDNPNTDITPTTDAIEPFDEEPFVKDMIGNTVIPSKIWSRTVPIEEITP